MSRTIKNITGAEFKAFWGDDRAWGADTFCEDLVFTIQGEERLDMDGIYTKYGDSFENLPDTALLDLESGYILQGGMPQPGAVPEEDLLVVFSDWKRDRDFVSFSASLDVQKTDIESLENISSLMDKLKALGATVHRSDIPNEKPKAGKPKP